MRFAVLAALLALTRPAAGVDRGNFKTCDESSFCKRQRALEVPFRPLRRVPGA